MYSMLKQQFLFEQIDGITDTGIQHKQLLAWYAVQKSNQLRLEVFLEKVHVEDPFFLVHVKTK